MLATEAQRRYTRTVMNGLLISIAMGHGLLAQGTDRLVSAEVRAASAPIAIAELSKQIGFPLEAMPSTAKDFMVIRVEKVPIHRLMKEIAEVTNTAWEASGSGFRLVRTDQTMAKEAAEERTELVKRIKESLGKLKARSTEEAVFNEQTAQRAADRLVNLSEQQNAGQPNLWTDIQRINSSGPPYRLMRKILDSLDAELIASIPPNRRHVFSDKPNQMQRQLPKIPQALVNQFLTEQEIWGKATQRARERRGSPEHFYLENAYSPGSRKVGKIICALSRHNQMPGITANISVLDSGGRTLGTATETLGWNVPNYASFLAEAQKLGENEERIEFTGKSLLMHDAITAAFQSSRQNNGAIQVVLSPDLREMFLNPDKDEPLSHLASDTLFGISKSKRLNLVANVPDEMMFGGSIAGLGAVKPSAVLAILPQLRLASRITDGWLQIEPIEPIAARGNRCDRFALGNFLRRAIKEGRISLDNRAEFVHRSARETEEQMSFFFLSMLGILKPGMDTGFGEWDAMRLYGSLTPAQRRLAKTAQPIPFRSLQPNQIEVLRHIVFDSSYSRLSVTWTEADFLQSQESGAMLMANPEVTEMLPNGFTGREVLTISDETLPRYFGSPDVEGSGGVRWGESAMDLNGIAYELFQSERPELFPWRNQPGYPRGNITKYRQGTNRSVQFNTKFTDRVSLNLQLNEKFYQGEAIPIDKFPADIRKQIDEHLARLRTQYKDAKPPDWNPVGGGNRVPPPHSR